MTGAIVVSLLVIGIAVTGYIYFAIEDRKESRKSDK